MLTKDPESFFIESRRQHGMDGWMDVQVLTYCVKLFPKRKNDQSAYIMGCQKFFNKTGKKSMNVPSK